jgi:tetratricopeptide (TPR) repeat protein
MHKLKPGRWNILALIWTICLMCSASPLRGAQATASKAEELAAAIANAANEKEEEVLLSSQKGLVSIELERALVAQGDRLFKTANYPRALKVYALAHHIAEDLNDPAGNSAALRGIGNIHYYHGDYSLALTHYQQSLKLAEGINDKTEIARTLSSIGTIYSARNDNTRALWYYRKTRHVNARPGANWSCIKQHCEYPILAG